MKRLESTFWNMSLSLTIISLVAAGALASVFALTEGPIEVAKEQKKEQSIKDVLPKFTRTDEPEQVDGLTIVRAYNADEFVGAAVETIEKGFGGDIKLMVGFDAEGKIVNYSVLEQAETPGLGTKMVDWFKTDKNRQSILGKNPSQCKFTVSKDGGDIDAITAATISSRAFLSAVSKAYVAYSGTNSDAISGASKQVEEEVVDTIPVDTVPEVVVKPRRPRPVVVEPVVEETVPETEPQPAVDAATQASPRRTEEQDVKSEKQDTL